MNTTGTATARETESGAENLLKRKVFGVFLSGTSGVCFAAASLFVKLCGDVPISVVILVRGIITILCCFCANQLIWQHQLFPRDKLMKLSIAGFLSFLMICGCYFAFRVGLPLGQVTLTISTIPLFVALFERIFLGMTLPWATIISEIVCVSGVVLLTYPDLKTVLDGTSHDIITVSLGFAAALGASLSQAASFVLIKQIEQHFVVTTFYLGLFCFATSIFTIPLQLHMSLELLHNIDSLQWTWVLLCGVFAVIATFSMFAGLHVERAVIVALVRNIDIAVAYIFDIALFHEDLLNPISLFGSGLIFLATVGHGIISIVLETFKPNEFNYTELNGINEHQQEEK